MGQTIELTILEKLNEAQSLIDLCPVHQQYRKDLEKASDLIDEVLDTLQPAKPSICCLENDACEG